MTPQGSSGVDQHLERAEVVAVEVFGVFARATEVSEHEPTGVARQGR